MKVKPMIFNTQMVRALLDGNKTQTRRPVKHQPFFSTSVIPSWVFPRNQAEVARGDSGLLYPNAKSSVLALSGYTPGDLIYVRETFGFIRPMDFGELPDVAYKADGYWSLKKWKPSIHMPREFSRITLKVTGVRVERIQGISEADAVAEGFRPKFDKEHPETVEGPNGNEHEVFPFKSPIDGFKDTWKKIYGDHWQNNGWCWVIDFEVIHKNVDHYIALQEAA